MKLSRRARSQAAAYAGIAAVLLLVTVVVPALGVFDVPELPAPQGRTLHGTVTRVLEERTQETERGEVRYQRLEVDLGDQTVTVEHSRTERDAGALEVGPGDRVLVGTSTGPDGTIYYIADHQRTLPLWALALAFAGLVLLVGRTGGMWSLVGMGASLLVIVRFIIPGILSGHNPVAVSILGALAIMVTTLFLAHGVNRKTAAALVGTAVSLGITAALATVSIAVARLSGIASDDAATLQILSDGTINAEGLLLGGIVIGALGVLDDVTVAQASAVFELRRANARLTALELYRRGMNVGRDHIASTVNTLVLAYAGAALPLLIILSTQSQPLGDLLNREFMATEIVRTLVGSMGIVAAVPVTTGLAALAAARLAPEAEAPGAADASAHAH
ncbi:MAG TPA: YibE/F family protein [Dehalococcoidia bacterium]